LDGTHTATCEYLENSPLVSQITFATSGQTVMTTTKQYGRLNRLTAIASHPGGTPAAASVSFAYGYNAASQRIRRTASDASYWLYTYDNLGQVVSGKKYWSDGTPVAGQQFEYGFDPAILIVTRCGSEWGGGMGPSAQPWAERSGFGHRSDAVRPMRGRTRQWPVGVRSGRS